MKTIIFILSFTTTMIYGMPHSNSGYNNNNGYTGLPIHPPYFHENAPPCPLPEYQLPQMCTDQDYYDGYAWGKNYFTSAWNNANKNCKYLDHMYTNLWDETPYNECQVYGYRDCITLYYKNKQVKCKYSSKHHLPQHPPYFHGNAQPCPLPKYNLPSKCQDQDYYDGYAWGKKYFNLSWVNFKKNCKLLDDMFNLLWDSMPSNDCQTYGYHDCIQVLYDQTQNTCNY